MEAKVMGPRTSDFCRFANWQMMFAKELEAARSEAKRLHAEVDALKSGGSLEARHLDCPCKQL